MLDWMFYSNSLRSWLLGAAAAALTVGALLLIRHLLAKRLRVFAERTRTHFDDVVASALDATRTWFLVITGLWAGSLALVVDAAVRELLDTATILALMAQIGIWGASAITAGVDGYCARKLEAGEGGAVTTMRALGFLGRLTLWALVLLVVLSNFGIQVTALIAGLGVGGIAVALAVQNILADLFSSLSIVLDKPFVAGDFVVVDDLMGTVERVGLKTTRVRSLSGEQLVFGNSDLLSSRIRNFKRLFERRVVFSFGVTYQTPHETLRSIPRLVQHIVEAQEKTRFDRAHFKSYGDSSLDFEVVYYVLDPNFNTYMDLHQEINLEIFRSFADHGIEFAYPTRTLYLETTSTDTPTGVGKRATPAQPG
ncbi:MAG: mechanosensitive ion channel family protein [Longimicrobiales bacterium]